MPLPMPSRIIPATTAAGASTPTTSRIPAAIRANTDTELHGSGQSRADRGEHDPAGDLRDADQPDREGRERRAVSALEQERDALHDRPRCRRSWRGRRRARATRTTPTAPPRGRSRIAASSRGCAGAARRATACSGIVTTASTTASTTRASRQPWASISACASGRKMKLASAATSVMRGHRAATLAGLGEPLGEHDEGRLVEHRRHHDADPGPQQVERRQTVHLRPGEHEHHPGDRAGGHERARAAAVEMPADGDARDRRHQQREREGSRELRRRVAELLLHRQQEHGEGVVEDPPRHRLGDRERPDDPPGPRAPCRRRGPVVELLGDHAAVTVLLFGEPLPQQADAAAAVSAGAAERLQTPVSGSTNSTLRALSQSPASAATTERTCS